MNIPHSLTLEQAVISGAMMQSEGWDLIAHVLTEGDFFSSQHRAIFKALHTLYSKNKPVDPLVVVEWLRANGLESKSGGESYIETIIINSPSSIVNIEIYAKKIRELSVERKLLAAADEIKELITNKNGLDTGDLLEQAEFKILSVSNNHSFDAIEAKTSIEVFNDIFERMDDALKRKDGELSGVKTGLTKVDEFTDGFQKQDLIFVGARPSMGKTTLGMNFVQAALLAQELPVVVFSMESPSYQIGQRLLASMSRVDLSKIVRGRFDGPEFVRVQAAIKTVKQTKLMIIDKGQLSPSDMRSVLRRVKREHGGIGLIMADYAQKMQLKGDHKKTRNEELCIISTDLKEIAKEFDCPFVCLAQLSKSCEHRPDKRPLMSDLRDCGGFEQDADIVMMLYRDEVYNKSSENQGIAEIIFRKNRNGPVDTVCAGFDGSTFRFYDIGNGGGF